MKLTRTSGTFGGTGYFRGDDGNYYYGTPSNSYVTETIQSQKQHAPQTSSSGTYDRASTSTGNTDNYSSGYGGGTNLNGSLLGAILFTVASLAVFSFLMCTMIIFAVFYAVFFSWPYYIRTTAQNYLRGAHDLPLILITVMLISLIAYFLFCSYKIFSQKQMRSKRYFITAVLAAGLLLALIRVRVGGFELSAVAGGLFSGLSLATLPTIVLCFFEHLVTKKQRGDNRWFITLVSKHAGALFSKSPVGMLPFGIIVVVLGTVFLFILGDAARINDIQFWNAFRAMGALFAAMGIIDSAR